MSYAKLQTMYATIKEEAIFLWSVPGPEKTMVKKMECYDHDAGLYIVQVFEDGSVEIFKGIT